VSSCDAADKEKDKRIDPPLPFRGAETSSVAAGQRCGRTASGRSAWLMLFLLPHSMCVARLGTAQVPNGQHSHHCPGRPAMIAASSDNELWASAKAPLGPQCECSFSFSLCQFSGQGTYGPENCKRKKKSVCGTITRSA